MSDLLNTIQINVANEYNFASWQAFIQVESPFKIDQAWFEVCKRYATASKSWISVKDRLPEKEFEYYLVFNTGNAIGSEKQIQPFINRFTSKVTHWMPLPEPPKL